MELLPISLTARRGNWQRFMARKAPGNKGFQAAKEKVLARDEHSCKYCGFYSLEYQEIVNIDQDYSNNTFANLATACSFCAQCFFLDSIGMDGKTGGTVIHLPEISQADLNHFCRAVYCSLLRDPPYKGKLSAVLLTLQDRGKAVENVFGPSSQEPMMFGQSLIDSQLSDEQLKHSIFSELRLLPARKVFKTQAEYWKVNQFSHLPL
jgi:intracellular multiplication protein IcmJ